jgi:prepilin-type N-terminal cleavage/methylation domain-containing protein
MPEPRRDARRFRILGFTLVEMMVAVALMTLIVAVAATVFKETSEIFRITNARVEIYQNGRAILDRMESEIRSAFIDRDGKYFYGISNGAPGGAPGDRLGETDTLLLNTSAEYFDDNGDVYRAHTAYYYVDNNKVFKKFISKDVNNLSAMTTALYEVGFNVWDLQLRYVGEDGNPVDAWNAETTKTLPVAVQVTLSLTDSTYTEKQTLVRFIRLG